MEKLMDDLLRADDFVKRVTQDEALSRGDQQRPPGNRKERRAAEKAARRQGKRAKAPA